MTLYGFKDRQTAETLKRMAEGSRPRQGPVPIMPAKGNGWIFRTQAEGIEERTNNTPGTADLPPYYVDKDGVLRTYKDSNGQDLTVTVYNIFATPVGPFSYITAKWVGNRCIVDAEDCPDPGTPLSWGGVIS